MVQGLEHFIEYKKLDKNNIKQIFFLFGGHTTYTKKFKAIYLVCEYGIIMMSFPDHAIHRLQPLDRFFFQISKKN